MSKTSNASTKRARRSRVAGDIISGLKEGVAFARGEISLPVRMVNLESLEHQRTPKP